MKKLKQQGFTLIELMASLTIGLILILALASLYVTAMRQDNNRISQEDIKGQARMLMGLLTRELRHAGYVDGFWQGTPKLSNVSAMMNLRSSNVKRMYARYSQTSTGSVVDNTDECDGTYSCLVPPLSRVLMTSTVTNNVVGYQNPTTVTVFPVYIAYGTTSQMGSRSPGLKGLPPSVSGEPNTILEVAYQADKHSLYDCTGASIPADYPFVRNRYILDKNAGVLKCIGNGAGSQAQVIANVVQFSAQYALGNADEINKEITDQKKKEESWFAYSEGGLSSKAYVSPLSFNHAVLTTQVNPTALTARAAPLLANGVKICFVLATSAATAGSVDTQAAELQNVSGQGCNGQPLPVKTDTYYEKFEFDVSLPNALNLSPILYATINQAAQNQSSP